jgi:hypothetical protein
LGQPVELASPVEIAVVVGEEPLVGAFADLGGRESRRLVRKPGVPLGPEPVEDFPGMVPARR